ncbi:hypothetical protein [Helicovermis profundi]|uniref:Lipoprotein n=1 Tax=Helicovermis profundi TaxID=3065157 RepID=A0AAU9E554_9FIRM|nr:hypothetical protein HLPR_07540 [Clostridia bacterium S502]
MKYKIVILGLIIILALTGCSSKATDKNEIKIKTLEEQNIDINVNDEENVSSSKTDSNYVDSANKTRIMGQVSKKVGNVITLDLYKMPERNVSSEKDSTSESNSSTTKTVSLVAGSAPVGGGMKPPGTFGKNNGFSARTSFEKTGETISLVIPVGTDIISRSTPNTSLDIDSLVKGINIMVVIDDELTNSEKLENPSSKTIYADRINIIQTTK